MNRQPLDNHEDVLDIFDPEQKQWLASQYSTTFPDGNGGRLHLLLGDSIARDAQVSVATPDLLLNRTRGGDSWKRLCHRVAQELEDWHCAASGYGVTTGHVAIWMTGNDLYPDGDPERRRRQLATLKDNMTVVLDAVLESCPVVEIIGPLPRLRHDIGRAWEQCPAFHGERMSLAHFGGRVTHWLVGRALTTYKKKRHVVGGRSSRFYTGDGVHLSEEGYERLLSRLPEWLQRP